jgi:lycopene cyclase-like protein
MAALDVLVLGKGPAALAAAAALAERGLAVGVLSPTGPVHWPAEYGAWADELERIGQPELAQHRWTHTVIGLGEPERRLLPHAYVRIDKLRLAEQLLQRSEAGGVRWLDGTAAGAVHDASGTTVRCRDGTEIRTRLVVDASGHRPVLVQRASNPAPGFQTAFGLVIPYDGPLFPPGQALLMDWDAAWLPETERAAAPPTFLYAMPLGDGRLFVEETVLVGRPAVSLKFLEQRLLRRLAHLGVPVGQRLEEERCWIPMGGALPDLSQRVVGFGGAAAMVHPATGYMLTRVLRSAPQLAAAVADSLGGNGASPERAARTAWEALWPPDQRHRRDLFCFGMEVLLQLNPRQTREFFAAFFSLPSADWQGYFNDRLSAEELRSVMARLFVSLPYGLQATLARAALSRSGLDLARSLLRQLRA